MAGFNVRHYLDPSTKGWIVTAIGKLTSQLGQLNDGTRNVLEKHVTATDVELRQVSNEVLRICQRLPFYILCLSYCQSNKGISLSECAIFSQRCSEIQELSQNAFLMQSVLPLDGCCEDLEVSGFKTIQSLFIFIP